MSDLPITNWPGFENPHYTQVPDELFDVLMPKLSHAELKVMLYLIRRTYGFKRDGDRISARQIAEGIQKADGTWLDHGTGCTIATVYRTVRRLEDMGLIIVLREVSAQGDSETNYYQVKQRGSVAKAPPTVGGSVARTLPSCPQDTTGVVSPGHPQDIVVQETVRQETVSLSSPLPHPPLDAPAAELAEEFFAALGEEHPASKRRERAVLIIHGLLQEGFDAATVRAATALAVSRQARGPELLPHLVGEAHTRSTAALRRETAATQSAHEQAQADAESQARYDALDALPEAQLQELYAEGRAAMPYLGEGAGSLAALRAWAADRLAEITAAAASPASP